jgi:flagellar biosynthesis/type III secretory pathway protein FliH
MKIMKKTRFWTMASLLAAMSTMAAVAMAAQPTTEPPLQLASIVAPAQQDAALNISDEEGVDLWFEHAPLGEMASQQRLESLRIMKESWPLFPRYESYLLPLALDEDILSGVVSLRPRLSGGEVLTYRPVVGNFPEHMHPELSVTIPFYLDKDGQPTQELFGTGFADPSKAVCVVLSDHGDVVPLDAARQAMQGFIEGFVTRLMIASLVNDWKSADVDIDPELFGLTLNRSKAQSELMKEFLKKDSFVTDAKTGAVNFEANMPLLLQRHSLHAHGLLTGWQAASELEAKRGRADEVVLDAARLLVAGRFSSYEQGHICASTLNYFFGLTWSNSARLEMMRRQADGPLDSSLSKEQMQLFRAESNEQVLQKVSNDPSARAMRSLVNDLGDLFDEYLESLRENSDMAPLERTLLVETLQQFNRGWRHGTTQAMEESFRIIFRTAADLAYVEGWGDGFSKGYADGYQNGHAVGYAQAWDEANVMISALKREAAGLKRESAKLRSQLTSAQKSNRALKASIQQLESQRKAGGGSSWSKIGQGLGKAASSFIGEATGFGTAKKLAKKLKFW